MAMTRRRGQASIEITVAFAGALLIFFVSLKIFVWLADRLIQRHRDYESITVDLGAFGFTLPGTARLLAGNIPIPYIVDPRTGEPLFNPLVLVPQEPPKLDIFEGD